MSYHEKDQNLSKGEILLNKDQLLVELEDTINSERADIEKKILDYRRDIEYKLETREKYFRELVEFIDRNPNATYGIDPYGDRLIITDAKVTGNGITRIVDTKDLFELYKKINRFTSWIKR